MTNKLFITACLTISIPASSYACAMRAYETKNNKESISVPFLVDLALIHHDNNLLLVEAQPRIECHDAEFTWYTNHGQLIQLSNHVVRLIPVRSQTHYDITANDGNLTGCGGIISVRVIH